MRPLRACNSSLYVNGLLWFSYYNALDVRPIITEIHKVRSPPFEIHIGEPVYIRNSDWSISFSYIHNRNRILFPTWCRTQDVR